MSDSERSPFWRLLHWGPIAVLFIIKLITWAMVHVLGMWWPPNESAGGVMHSAVFLAMAAFTLYYFLQSLLEGPGYVPHGWKPEKESDTQHLQYCTVCKGYKPPRAHHCKRCSGDGGRCVLKMDHHCPWINCCVGHNNHCYFVLFLTAAVFGCLHASIVLPICVYSALSRVWAAAAGHPVAVGGPAVHLTLTTLLLTLLAIGMAFGVVMAVSALLYIQIRGVLRNQTTIEEWIVEKAKTRREEYKLPKFEFPYNLGWQKNLNFIFFNFRYDGVNWPVKPGCDEYDLTREQLAQKVEKLERSRLFTAVQGYDGRWFPLVSRPRAAVCAPCTDEPRLPLRPGDTLRATRHRKHWLFGEKLSHVEGERGPRGWFPRAAAVPTSGVHPTTGVPTAPRQKHD